MLLGRQEPADHLLPHPLAVDTQRQHAQAVLVVTGEGAAVVPGAWGQGIVSRGPVGGPPWQHTPAGWWVPATVAPWVLSPAQSSSRWYFSHVTSERWGPGSAGGQVARRPSRYRASRPVSGSRWGWPWGSAWGWLASCGLLRGLGVSCGGRGHPPRCRGGSLATVGRTGRSGAGSCPAAAPGTAAPRPGHGGEPDEGPGRHWGRGPAPAVPPAPAAGHSAPAPLPPPPPPGLLPRHGPGERERRVMEGQEGTEPTPRTSPAAPAAAGTGFVGLRRRWRPSAPSPLCPLSSASLPPAPKARVCPQNKGKEHDQPRDTRWQQGQPEARARPPSSPRARGAGRVRGGSPVPRDPAGPVGLRAWGSWLREGGREEGGCGSEPSPGELVPGGFHETNTLRGAETRGWSPARCLSPPAPLLGDLVAPASSSGSRCGHCHPRARPPAPAESRGGTRGLRPPYSPQSFAGRTAACSRTSSSHMPERGRAVGAAAGQRQRKRQAEPGRAEPGHGGGGKVSAGAVSALVGPSQQKREGTSAGGEAQGRRGRPAPGAQIRRCLRLLPPAGTHRQGSLTRTAGR